MSKRANEPAVWFLFGTGGFFTAYFLPIQILLYGILIPLSVANPGFEWTRRLFEFPLTRIYLAVLCFFGFFHAAHRIRLTLVDLLRVKHLETALGVILYTAAAVGTGFAVYLAIIL
jgi:succinate dehydrogenase subunit D